MGRRETTPRWEDSALTLTLREGASARGHSLARGEGAGPYSVGGRLKSQRARREGRGHRARVAKSISPAGPPWGAARGRWRAWGGRGRGHCRAAQVGFLGCGPPYGGPQAGRGPESRPPVEGSPGLGRAPLSLAYGTDSARASADPWRLERASEHQRVGRQRNPPGSPHHSPPIHFATSPPKLESFSFKLQPILELRNSREITRVSHPPPR